jgi:Ca2+-binding RTX toxin-like protein
VVACLFAQVGLFAPSASAIPFCFMSGNDLVVNPSPNQDLDVFSQAGNLHINSADCGSLAAIETVRVPLFNDEPANLTFGLSPGPLGPGLDEPGDSDEVEFDVTGVDDHLRVQVEGTSGSDGFSVGTTIDPGNGTAETQLNLNGPLDGATPDADVFLDHAPSRIVLRAYQGTDTLSGQGIGVKRSLPTDVPLVLEGREDIDSVTGGNGNDTLESYFQDEADTYSGGGGDDTIDMQYRSAAVSVTQDGLPNDGESCPGACEGDDIGSDIEKIIGGSGNDTLTGGAGPQSIEGGPGNDTIAGRAGNDLLNGGGGTAAFSGGDGTNSLSGGFGNDTLISGTLADDLHGNKGGDAVTYETHPSRVEIQLNGLADDGSTGEHDNVRSDVETVIGSSRADRLVGNAGRNHLVGSLGNDELLGNGGPDLLQGGGWLIVDRTGLRDGDDSLFGGSGVDTVAESVSGGPYSLTIDNVANDGVGDGADNIHTDVENLVGGDRADHLVGGAGNNKLMGGRGNDTLEGAGGNDQLLPGAGIDTVNGGAATDTAVYSNAPGGVTVDTARHSVNGDGEDTLSSVERELGSRFDDHFLGSSSGDVFTGAAGDDVFYGFGGDDTMSGGSGNDVFDGGPGSDKCSQGPGTGSKTACER